MRGIKALWATVSVLALTAGVSLLPTQAAAQINIPGAVFGALHGGFPSGGGGSYRSHRGSSHESSHDRHSKDAKGDDEPTEHSSASSSASNGKSGSERELSAPVKGDPQPPSQPQPQTAASGPAPKSGGGEEPSFSPSR
jgi:hypothetical protein